MNIFTCCTLSKQTSLLSHEGVIIKMGKCLTCCKALLRFNRKLSIESLIFSLELNQHSNHNRC